MNSEPKNMPIEASDREMDTVMLGIESRTIGEEMPKKLEKMLIQRSAVKRKKDSSTYSGSSMPSSNGFTMYRPSSRYDT